MGGVDIDMNTMKPADLRQYFKCIEDKIISITDHWFVDKRNEITKQHPFRILKRITISVYMPSEEITITERQFSVEGHSSKNPNSIIR